MEDEQVRHSMAQEAVKTQGPWPPAVHMGISAHLRQAEQPGVPAHPVSHKQEDTR